MKYSDNKFVGAEEKPGGTQLYATSNRWDLSRRRRKLMILSNDLTIVWQAVPDLWAAAPKARDVVTVLVSIWRGGRCLPNAVTELECSRSSLTTTRWAGGINDLACQVYNFKRNSCIDRQPVQWSAKRCCRWSVRSTTDDASQRVRHALHTADVVSRNAVQNWVAVVETAVYDRTRNDVGRLFGDERADMTKCPCLKIERTNYSGNMRAISKTQLPSGPTRRTRVTTENKQYLRFAIRHFPTIFSIFYLKWK